MVGPPQRLRRPAAWSHAEGDRPLSRQLVGRLGAVLYVICGLAVAASLALPLAAGANRTAMAAVAAAAVLVGLVEWVLPWQRWRRSTALLSVPIAFTLVALVNRFNGGDGYHFTIFFLVAFMWIGVGFPRWTSLLFVVPLVCAAVLPLLALDNLSVATVSPVVYTVPVCVLVSETLAWVSERLRVAREQLRYQASYDGLTGLYNRTVFHERVHGAVGAVRHEAGSAAVLLVDLDRFKEVNDTLGHSAGDVLLQHVAALLRELVPDHGTVARLGGDEFALLLPSADEAGAAAMARRVAAALQTRVVIDGVAIDVGGSIGVALSPRHGTAAETLLRCADVAMYAAKRGHAGHLVYQSELDRHSARHLALVGELREAIAQDRLLLHYQPKVALDTGWVCGVEALLRWNHPEHGFIPPNQFVALAERSALIAPLTLWVLERAVRQCQSWMRAGLRLDLAVNLSMRTLHDRHFPETVAALLRRHGVAPGQLTLEITESALMDDRPRAQEVVVRLLEQGLRVAIDDFGTGYSSLGYLKHLPVHEIKIDKSFVLGLGSAADATDMAIVRAVIDMAKALHREVVAEGVERAEAYDVLRSLGCDVAQGYYLSRPLPPAELERWVRTMPASMPRWSRERAGA